MNVARTPTELGPGPRAVALGTFDGVHLGHRRVVDTLLDAGPEPTVVTFDPHPRTALGNRVDLLTPLERRLELLAELGVAATLVVEFTLDVAGLEPQEFAEQYLRPIRAETVVAGEDFRFARARQGDLALLERLGFATRPVPLLADVSSTRIRELVREGYVQDAARLLGRPVEVEGIVVTGDARASRPRTSTSAQSCSCRRTGSTRARPGRTARPSRSGRTRITAAASGASKRSSSISQATFTVSG